MVVIKVNFKMMKISEYKNRCLAMLLIVSLFAASCSKDNFPVDEDGLLITGRTSAYVGSFELLGLNQQTVRTQVATIDTVAQTIDVQVHFGTDLTRLWPQFSLITDAKLEPKVTDYVDFSDMSNPKQWTVVSGNRQVRKTYTVRVTVQQPEPQP